jgi:hypothetical protein
MSTRTKKTVTTSLSPEELVALDRVRKRDNLTRAEALRAAIRRYISQNSDRKIPVEDALPDEIEAIEEGQAQIARGEYVLLDDLKHEMGRPHALGPGPQVSARPLRHGLPLRAARHIGRLKPPTPRVSGGWIADRGARSLVLRFALLCGTVGSRQSRMSYERLLPGIVLHAGRLFSSLVKYRALRLCNHPSDPRWSLRSRVCRASFHSPVAPL